MSSRKGASSSGCHVSLTSVKPRWESPRELPWPGKCFRQQRMPLRAVRLDDGAGVADDDPGVGREAAREFADDRVFRVDVEVDQGGEIEVETGCGQDRGGGGGMAPGQLRVVGLAQAARADRRREAVLFFQPRHLPALLVDGDQQGNGGGLLQRGDEFLHLAGRADVAPVARQRQVAVEQHHAADAAGADVACDGGAPAGLQAAEADHQQLADLFAQGHRVTCRSGR